MENGKNTSMNLSRDLPYQKIHPLGDAALIWIVIGKMFTNQSITKNKAVINGER